MHWLEQHWYPTGASSRLLTILLWPLSLLFGLISGLRRAAYRQGVLQSTRLPVPVIVIGNISVGGTGKTPLTIALAAQISQHRFRPGIVCRGYGGSARTPRAVSGDDDPRICGDEAVLLAKRCSCPVWIGANRVTAARGLLNANPDCTVILSDDGLQHYALARNFEIAVLDSTRGLGNGRLLPAGPLREPPARLVSVDAVIINGTATLPPMPAGAPQPTQMTLQGDRFLNVLNPQRETGASQFAGLTVHAVAAIGNPERFFGHLRALGIVFEAHAFPDHHDYRINDLAFGDASVVIMTEKDAVKCRPFATQFHWALRVDAEIDGDLTGQIMRTLGKQI